MLRFTKTRKKFTWDKELYDNEQNYQKIRDHFH